MQLCPRRGCKTRDDLLRLWASGGKRPPGRHRALELGSLGGEESEGLWEHRGPGEGSAEALPALLTQSTKVLTRTSWGSQQTV